MILFQKNLVVWKQGYKELGYSEEDAVSEELSSVETGLSGGRRANYIRFQKNLVVWKLRLCG